MSSTLPVLLPEVITISGANDYKAKRSSGDPNINEDCDKSTKRRKVAYVCKQCEEDIPRFKTIFQNRDLPPYGEPDVAFTSRTWPVRDVNQHCELCPLFFSQDTRAKYESKGTCNPVSVNIYKVRFLQAVGERRYPTKNSREWSSDAFKIEREKMDSVCLASRVTDDRKSPYRSIIVPALDGSTHLAESQETGHFSLSQSYSARLVNSKRFDDGLVTSWIRTCKELHENNCTPTVFKQRSDESTVTSHRIWLIDCNTRRLCAAQVTEPYIALSYVWGSSHRRQSGCTWEHGPGAKLPDTLPMTIEDAISVTLRLSRRYLWVDYYCINQNDQTHKASQIAIMDLIYGCSELVLIAAAGNDAEYGLLGVGRIERVPQSYCEVDGELTLVSHLDHPHSAIYHSTWNSRGWTFQEAMLATRRLVFTDKQVYFECKCISVWESLHRPLERITETGTKRLKRGSRAGFFQSGCAEGKTFSQNGSTGIDPFPLYIKAVTTYSLRHLTFQEDYLNAFQGFLRALYPGKNFHGLPLDLYYVKRARQDRDTPLRSITLSLSWWHDTQINRPEYKESVRREGFPSFSWTGWTGKPEFKSKYRYHIRSIYSTVVTYPSLDLKKLLSGQASSLTIKGFTSRIVLVCTYERAGKFSYSLQENLLPGLRIDYLKVSWPAQGEALKRLRKSEIPTSKFEVNILCLLVSLQMKIILLFERKECFIERCGIMEIGSYSRSSKLEDLEPALLEPWKEEVVVLR